ncbi:MAG: putative bifunctional diguanylate cyclase/phosphodiesterase, partial [Stenotrophobium sp.]
GLIMPMYFIPLAEDTGQIVPIGEWVLRSACRQLKSWHQQGQTQLSVAINLSPRQFQQQDIPALVREVLDETGLPPASLHLELTENIILRQSESATNALRQLKALGVLLAIDDFGTGYSSLGYLKRFPVDIIKIDQSFVLDLIANPDAAFIIRAIISMAKSLNMKTVAEGVETREQMDFLVESGCDAIQGFYISRALPAEEYLRFVMQSVSGGAPGGG